MMKAVILIDMHNDSYFHASFNAGCVKLFPEVSKIYIRPGHLPHLDLCLAAGKQNNKWSDKLSIIKRLPFFPAFIQDAFKTLQLILQHRKDDKEILVLTASTTTLALIVLFSSVLPSVAIFTHSLESMIRRSQRAAKTLYFCGLLSKLSFKSTKSLVLIFQRQILNELNILKLLSKGSVSVHSIYLPHPIEEFSVPRSLIGNEKRRLIFLGDVRIEKCPDLYLSLAKKTYLSDNYKFYHAATKQYDWGDREILFLRVVGPLVDCLKSSDIVFCAYDDAHYEITESGTFIDSMSKGCWALVTQTRKQSLQKQFSSFLKIVNVSEDYALVKPIRKFAYKVNAISREIILKAMVE